MIERTRKDATHRTLKSHYVRTISTTAFNSSIAFITTTGFVNVSAPFQLFEACVNGGQRAHVLVAIKGLAALAALLDWALFLPFFMRKAKFFSAERAP